MSTKITVCKVKSSFHFAIFHIQFSILILITISLPSILFFFFFFFNLTFRSKVSWLLISQSISPWSLFLDPSLLDLWSLEPQRTVFKKVLSSFLFSVFFKEISFFHVPLKFIYILMTQIYVYGSVPLLSTRLTFYCLIRMSNGKFWYYVDKIEQLILHIFSSFPICPLSPPSSINGKTKISKWLRLQAWKPILIILSLNPAKETLTNPVILTSYHIKNRTKSHLKGHPHIHVHYHHCYLPNPIQKHLHLHVKVSKLISILPLLSPYRVLLR